MIVWRNLKPASVLAAVGRLAKPGAAGGASRGGAPKAGSRPADAKRAAPAKAGSAIR